MYAPPKSPDTQIKSPSFAPDLLTIAFLLAYPIAVTEIAKPVTELLVSPPISCTSYFSHAALIPT